MIDRITRERSTNARVLDRVPRVRPSVREPKRSVARFGSRTANSLLLLELAAARKLESGWDSEWFQGEFLARLRVAFFAAVDLNPAERFNYDWNADFYEYESVDVLILCYMSKAQYRALLWAVLRSIYDEEGLGGTITRTVARVFRLPHL